MNFMKAKYALPWVVFISFCVKDLIFPCNFIDLGVTAIAGAVLCAFEHSIKMNFIAELEQVKLDYNKIIEDLYNEVKRNREEVQSFKLVNQYKTLANSITGKNG